MAVAGIVAGATCAVAACFIDLDPPMASFADGDAETGAPDSEVADGGNDGALIAPECATPADCDPGTTGRGCLTTQCIDGRCIHELCRTTNACAIARCVLEGPGTCGAEEQLPFIPGSFVVPISTKVTALPCSTLEKCTTASYPFFFAVDGLDTVSGYVVADPREASPRKVSVDKLGFAPAQILASGRRVYFVGAMTGAAGALALPLGWFDVPSNPFATRIPIHNVTLRYTGSTVAIPTLLPAPNDSVYLVTTATRETAIVSAPVADRSDLIAQKPLPNNNGVGILVPSGSQLAGGTVGGTGNSYFLILAGPGTSIATLKPAVITTPSLGLVADTSQFFMGSGPRGEVLAAVATLGPTPADGGTPDIAKTRVAWAVEPGAAVVEADLVAFDLSGYAAGTKANAKVIGPVVGVDAGALVLHADSTRSNTILQRIERIEKEAPTADPLRVATFPYDAGPPSSYVMNTSRGIVYVATVLPTAEPNDRIGVTIAYPDCVK